MIEGVLSLIFLMAIILVWILSLIFSTNENRHKWHVYLDKKEEKKEKQHELRCIKVMRGKIGATKNEFEVYESVFKCLYDLKTTNDKAYTKLREIDPYVAGKKGALVDLRDSLDNTINNLMKLLSANEAREGMNLGKYLHLFDSVSKEINSLYLTVSQFDKKYNNILSLDLETEHKRKIQNVLEDNIAIINRHYENIADVFRKEKKRENNIASRQLQEIVSGEVKHPKSERKIKKEVSSGPTHKVKYSYTNKKSANEDIQHSVLQQPMHNVYHSHSSSSHCNSSSSYDNSSNYDHSSSYDSGSSGGGCDY
ncbi:hypothetical protein [Bacillus pumilus]|uniref:hypothetical protein n=1 Tax=Bacillus pumilus TaxID=1408 RepID=UPI0011A7777C|nr:hypothetical protein [Bacillus pumilus]